MDNEMRRGAQNDASEDDIAPEIDIDDFLKQGGIDVDEFA